MEPILFKQKQTVVESRHTHEQPKRALFMPAGHHDGCTAWRFDWVREFLNYNKHAIIDMSTLPPIVGVMNGQKPELNPMFTILDAFVIQRPVNEQHSNMFQQYVYAKKKVQEVTGKTFRIVVDIDDVLHYDYISEFNSGRAGYAGNVRFNTFSDCVKQSDELVVCSPTMRDFYLDHIDFKNITYKPNLMPRYMFDFYDLDRQMNLFEENKKKPRILWAGSWSHIDVKKNTGNDDFTDIVNLVRKTVKDYQWIFYGAYPLELSDLVNDGSVEYHKWTGIHEFPTKFLSLKPNAIIAPLYNNVFNRCKSNIKLTEAGAMGIAGVYQDLDPYYNAPLKFNNADEMADQLKFLLTDENNHAKVLKDMYDLSEGFFLETNTDVVYATIFTEYGSPLRKITSPKLEEIQNIHIGKPCGEIATTTQKIQTSLSSLGTTKVTG